MADGNGPPMDAIRPSAVQAETLRGLPKGHPERTKVADKIRTLRSVERTYETGRDGVEYVRELQGVQELFQYVRDLNTGARIIDIGAGVTRAMRDFSKVSFGEGLSFGATVLTKPEISEWTLSSDQIHITPVELLNGIENESVGGALGVYSVAYSENPKFAVRGLNRVLVPGGVFKGVFKSKNGEHGAGLKSYHEFQDEFRDLGYDTASFEGDRGDIFLAIKPGGSINEIDAATLLEQDRKSTATQTIKLLEMKRKEEEEQYKDF